MMFKLIKETYGTYLKATTLRERHWPRLFGFACLAGLICLFSDQSSKEIYGMMITGLTILTGFTFTALFSDHSLADVGLPKPKSETDILELKKLGVLAVNFLVRSKYFIALSIIDVCILIIISAGLSIPAVLSEFLMNFISILSFSLEDIAVFLKEFAKYTFWIISFFSIFIFLECLYTFYRLSETIISIVNSRRDYLRS